MEKTEKKELYINPTVRPVIIKSTYKGRIVLHPKRTIVLTPTQAKNYKTIILVSEYEKALAEKKKKDK